MVEMRWILVVVALSAGLNSCVLPGVAQEDRVLRGLSGGGNSQLRGKFVNSSALAVTIEVDGKNVDVPASEVNKVVFGGEPRAMSRVRDLFENGRYDDCLAAIKSLSEQPESKWMQQEVRFFEAFATGKKVLQSGSGIETGEQVVGEFVKSNTSSFRLVPAIDLYGQLLMAAGKVGEAQNEYNKLTKSRWDEYVVRGYFFQGETMILQGDLQGAAQSYSAIAEVKTTDPKAAEYRLLAECQLAKIAAMQGDWEKGAAAVEQIIQNEEADNVRLFAYAYNALGACYQQSGDLKKASRAYLHTDLLFFADPYAHAEALYHLSQIWPSLNHADRANRAREQLTGRYRNSVWANKL